MDYFNALRGEQSRVIVCLFFVPPKTLLGRFYKKAMFILFTISLIIFLSYVIGICVFNKKIPQSISDSFYLLEKKKKNLGWLFSLFCYAVMFTAIPLMFEITENVVHGEYHSVAMIAGVGLGLVGTAPHFKSTEKALHYSGAIACLLGSQLWCLMTIPIVVAISWSIYILSTIIYLIRNNTDIVERDFLTSKPMFWIEITTFISTYTTIALCMI